MSDGIGDDHGKSFDGAYVIPWVYAVFPDGIPNGHAFEMSKYVGFTSYEFTGYFSGRMLNFYQWSAAQSNEPEEPPMGGEEESDRQSRYAEFCVEDWCYRPDPDPVRFKSVLSREEIAHDRAEYAGILTEMKRAGARRCGERSAR